MILRRTPSRPARLGRFVGAVLAVVVVLAGAALVVWLVFRPGAPPAGAGGPAPPTVAQVAPELPPFGDLASVQSQPASRQIGPEAATIPLSEGAQLLVPAGAFPRESRLTTATLALDLARLDANVKQARVYVFSTAEPFDPLGAPVVLEIPRPPECVSVVRRMGDGWRAVPAAPGPTTRVEITHFSEQEIAVIDWNEKIRDLVQWENDKARGLGRAMVEGVERQDEWTKAFFGVGEKATRTPGQICAEFKAVLRRYKGESHVAFPDDEPHGRLFGFLFPASPPSESSRGFSKYYWNKVAASLPVIEARTAARAAQDPVSPAAFLEICIDANGGNVPLGVLAAHNYLKENAYQGRGIYAAYLDAMREAATDEAREALRRRLAAAMEKWGRQARCLEPWRQDPVAQEGYYDKMGPNYHVFAALAVTLWGGQRYGYFATTAEALLRAGWAPVFDDKPDVVKDRTDDCGYELGKWILSGMPDDEPPPPPSSKDKDAPQPPPTATTNGPDLTNTRWLFEAVRSGPDDAGNPDVVPGYLEFFEGKPGGTVRAGSREKGIKFVDWAGTYDGKRLELKAVPRELTPEEKETLAKLGRTGRVEGFGPGDVGTFSAVLDGDGRLMTGTVTLRLQETPTESGPLRTAKFKGAVKAD